MKEHHSDERERAGLCSETRVNHNKLGQESEPENAQQTYLWN